MPFFNSKDRRQGSPDIESMQVTQVFFAIFLATAEKVHRFSFRNHVVISHVHMQQNVCRTKDAPCLRCREKALSLEQHDKQYRPRRDYHRP